MTDGLPVQHVGIGELISSCRIAVPENQRPFSWDASQADELLDDITAALWMHGDEEYFLGSVVLTKTPETPLRSRNDRAKILLQVVDGQQRLATVMMLYAAIRHELIARAETEPADHIFRTILTTMGERWKSGSDPRLKMGEDDDGFFRQIILSPTKENVPEISKRSPQSHRRMAECYARLVTGIEMRLRGKDIEAINDLRELDLYLTDKVKVIAFTAKDNANAFQVFESLNARGADLEIADLLKNFLFGKVDEPHKAEVKHHWNVARTHLSPADGNTLKKFIHHFWASKEGLTRERELYRNLRGKIKTSRLAIEFVTELSKNADHYAAILNSDHPFWSGTGEKGRDAIATLRTLKMDQYKPLLLAVMDTFDESASGELLKVLQMLVTATVRFRITGELGSSNIEQLYGKAGKDVRDKKMRSAKEVLQWIKSDLPSDAVFELKFAEHVEENRARARFYLRAIENTVRRRRGPSALEAVRDADIVNWEHILPQAYNLTEWKRFDAETAELYVDRLGNQSLLLKGENGKLGNKPFRLKLPVYQNSELIHVRDVANYAKSSEWSPDNIDARQRDMAKVALLTWSIDW